MKTHEDVKAELRALADEINEIIATTGAPCGYSHRFFEVLEEHPDLGARWDHLRHETFKVRELQ